MTKKEHQYTILIIDDEAVIRETFRNYLEDYGYRIFTGENGETGIQLLEREIPDIVLTDLRMPGIDGFAVIAPNASPTFRLSWFLELVAFRM